MRCFSFNFSSNSVFVGETTAWYFFDCSTLWIDQSINVFHFLEENKKKNTIKKKAIKYLCSSQRLIIVSFVGIIVKSIESMKYWNLECVHLCLQFLCIDVATIISNWERKNQPQRMVLLTMMCRPKYDRIWCETSVKIKQVQKWLTFWYLTCVYEGSFSFCSFYEYTSDTTKGFL